MYYWKLAGVWMKTGSRLEVDWKWIGSRLEQTGGRLEEAGRRLVQKWFNQILR